MDDPGQIGPGKGDYAADVRRIDQLLRMGGTVYAALADRGGRLNLVLTRKHKMIFPGAEPEGHDGGDGGWLFVAIEGHGASWFSTGGYQAPAYVADKLDVGRGDGEIVAEFLMRLGAVDQNARAVGLA